ncbi:hypothetical protein EJ05DRAFT_234665 [Pseudovirgaria hyperparasitica]|uniref:Uncharacterized protein n=1 Tax=Pseudovirgaria hyperparasitica TaxID=470096 RepID=A0A6A6VTL1_9PEZI|nr:uncharacterized protein EJ05DRAFT_234665 [Pseudovirgaria hyperparasitica]KAF2752940.1 hypothetical protein EJ05DRAFT_234665 [Pseudovirgaria hyperparasitica]
MSTIHLSVSGEQFGSSPCQWPENQPSSPYTVTYRNSQLNLDGRSICPSPHVIDDICTEGLGIAVGRSHYWSGATLHRAECSLKGPCRQTFLRHDNYLAHFRTHLVQDTRGLFFPQLNNTELYADLIALVPVLRSGVDTGNMHRYHRNTRVSWENLVERVREAKGALVADQILVTILRACLRHDARVAQSFC